MIDQHLSRWIFACVTTHFLTRSQGIQSFIEGQIKQDLAIDHYEIRMNGPDIRALTRNERHIDIEVNIFCASAINDTNFHRIHDMAGIMAAAFTDIGIFRVGPTDPVNDGTYIGCLTCDGIRVLHFGQLDPSKDLVRASVTGKYSGHITL